MSQHPRLLNLKGRYYIRTKVLTDLLGRYDGKEEIKYSLRTSDYREAVRNEGETKTYYFKSHQSG